MPDVAEALIAIEDRGACTDAERRAALWLHDELRARGHEAWVETVWVRPQWAGSLFLHAVLGVAASLAATAVPALGLVAFGLAVSYAAELVGFPLLARLLVRRATQVVVVEPPDGSSAQWLVAPTDAPRGGVARRWLRLPFLWAVVVALLWVVVMGAVRASGSEGGWVGAVQLVPTVALLGFAAAALDVVLSKWTAGEDEAREAAAAVDALDERPAGLLLCGAHLPFERGLRAWRRSSTTSSGAPVTSAQVKRNVS